MRITSRDGLTIPKLAIYLILARSPFFVFFVALYYFFNKSAFFAFIKKIYLFILFILIACLYSLIQGNSTRLVLGQAKDILLSLIVLFFLISFCLVNRNGDYTVYKTLKFGLIVIAVIKILILVFAIATGTNPMNIILSISEIWGVDMMTLGVEDSNVVRIQIPMDAITPFVIYFCVHEMLNGKIKISNIATLIILLSSVLLTMSRYFWAETVFLVMFSFLLNARFKSWVYSSIVVLVISSFFYFLTPLGEVINSILNARVDSMINRASDMSRTLQINAILRAIEDKPLWGYGIGYYLPEMIRSYEVKYLYENQSLSMIMSLGVIGFLIFCGMLLFSFLIPELLSGRLGVINLSIGFVMFALWMAGGSFNPFLFGASGGIILFFCARYSHITEKIHENRS
ncbi:O-antigen ligase family protein [Brenneria goodwinii]|uniref:O-antigen ligase family protein n=1 Tax=Brenneria goodwinii TaxID=1109412 RepID=UPI0036EDC4F9